MNIVCLLGLHKMIFKAFWKGIYRPHFKCTHCGKERF